MEKKIIQQRREKTFGFDTAILRSFFLISIVMLMSVSLISAIELNPFATKKIIDEPIVSINKNLFMEREISDYPLIKISKTFLWFESDRIAEYKITDNTKVCGTDCYMEGKAILYAEGTLFDDAEFIDLSNDEDKTIPYKYFIRTPVEPTITEICYIPIRSKEEVCYSKITPNKPNEWVAYNFEDLTAGQYEWRLEGTKDFYESIDAIPVNKISFDEWADWGAGGTVFYDGDFTVHTFLTNGTFNTTSEGNITFLVIGGGGAGGGSAGEGGGGAGAGGWVNGTNYTLGIGTHNITVGVGGVGVQTDAGTNGTNSSLDTFIAFGGGAGGKASGPGSTGGSGGGGGVYGPGPSPGGASIQVSYGAITGFGFAGADSTVTGGAGGGGGAGELGNGGVGTQGGDGGDGMESSINGTSTYYAGGGGGVYLQSGSSGGLGGGGDGEYNGGGGTDGVDGKGGGGGGNAGAGGSGIGYDGGDGIVIIRYETVAVGVTVTLDSPADNNISLNQNVMFKVNSSIDSATLTNTTLYVWNASDEALTNFSLISGSVYSSNLSLYLDFGVYTWNEYSCADTPTCSWGQTNKTITTVPLIEDTHTFNLTSLETATENYAINFTTHGTQSVSGDLIYNGTLYSGTKTGTDAEPTLTATVDIGTTALGNKSFYWNITVGSNTSRSTTQYQNISEIVFAQCNATYNIAYTNITIKDEGNLSIIPDATIPLLDLSYYVGSGNQVKNFTFTNNTGNANYSFCFSPTDKNVIVDFSLQYEDENGDYPQRVFQDEGILSNASNNLTLYLLKTADGQYVTFQFINVAEQPIENVHTTATRIISGSTVTVGEGDSDAAGGITFWLNPNFAHIINANATGYTFYSTSLTPTQTSYTIDLGSSTISVDDYSVGVTYVVEPTNLTLFNDTAYNFNFGLASSFWTVTEFGFTLTNSSDIVVGSNSVSSDGGTATTNYNVGNVTDYLTMNYYWIIEGNYTNGSRNWYVMNSAGTDWSIKVFFEDLESYIDVGLFGLDSFGKAILIFLIIFIFTGIMSYKYGLISPVGISTISFGMVLFLDVGLNIMSDFNAIGGVPHFPTIFMAIVMIAMFFREVVK